MYMRVVSLVPSLTELVWWFGVGDSLVGRTRFCTEPAGQIEAVPVVGGTKNPKVERIIALRPDFVIANKEENRREDVEALRAAELNVVVTDPNSVDEAVAMVKELGALLGCESRASDLKREVEAALAEPGPQMRARVFVAVWKGPLLGLGANTYGHDLVQRAGAENVLATRTRYPEVTETELIDLRPELILLPDEPFAFTEGDVAEFGRVAPARLIDGKLLWWYGPRMAGAIRALRATFADV
jgi:ABC-type hemin transport system substrate-binding protein